MPWCLDLLRKKLTKETVRRRFQALEQFARTSYPRDGCIDLPWLGEVLRQIDHLWYDNQLLKSLQKTYGGLKISIDVDDPRVAGYVLETPNGRGIGLHMNRNLFAALFPQNEHGYHSGGLLCRDKLVCFLHVLLHETVHLVLTLCDRLGLRPDIRHHGREFNRIVKRLFGQTDSQHGLLQGYNQFHSLDDIKRLVSVGTNVEVWVEGVWVKGTVQKKGRKFAEVKCNSGTRYKVNMGLLRISPTP